MKFLILGGGISGLSAAWFLHRRYPDAKITLLEKEKRLGGWIETSRGLEKGPRTFQKGRSPHLLALIRELGLEGEILESDPSASRKYLWHRGKLQSMRRVMPALLFSLLRKPFVKGAVAADESIYEFAVRRFSPKVAELLFDPLTLGIYGGDIRKLSMRSCFGAFSLPKALMRSKGGLFTLRGGFDRLITALQKKLPIEIALGCKVEAIHEKEVTAGGKIWKTDRIFSALPGPAIGRLSGDWGDFPALSLSLVQLEYRNPVLPKRGFGYLVPSQEREPLLGMVWDSSIFPQQGMGTRVTAIFREQGDAVSCAQEAMQRHLGVKEKPIWVSSFVAKEAIPQFEVGYQKRLERFERGLKERFPSLILLGNYLEGASVDACIRRSLRLAEEEI